MESIPSGQRRIKDDLIVLAFVLGLCLLAAATPVAMMAEWRHDAHALLWPTEGSAIICGIAVYFQHIRRR
jgi:hypothetical protein